MRHHGASAADCAGWVGAVSAASALAGKLVAFGATVLLLALAAAAATGAGLEVDLQTDSWRDAGVTGGAILAGVLFVSYLFAGYTAGRMARRRGVLHGLMVDESEWLLMETPGHASA